MVYIEQLRSMTVSFARVCLYCYAPMCHCCQLLSLKTLGDDVEDLDLTFEIRTVQSNVYSRDNT